MQKAKREKKTTEKVDILTINLSGENTRQRAIIAPLSSACKGSAELRRRAARPEAAEPGACGG